MKSSSPHILVTEPIPEKVLSFLKNHADVTVGDKPVYNDELKLHSDISGYDALLCMLSTPVTAKVLEAGENLKIVANFAVGYDNIDVKAAHD
ncbi:MAG: D-glycerate dehydrogenase, partial [Balneolaceae bacterium]